MQPSRLSVAQAVTKHHEGTRRFRPGSANYHCTYLEWAVDGIPLRRIVADPDGWVCDGVTLIQMDHVVAGFEARYLRAALGEGMPDEETVMSDGRLPLLVCGECFDFDCGTLTTQLVIGSETVEWRDIAWQTNYSPLDLADQDQPVITLVFERAQYESLERPLLVQSLRE